MKTQMNKYLSMYIYIYIRIFIYAYRLVYFVYLIERTSKLMIFKIDARF